ncbi:MAG: hypothetical protein KGP27_01315 [Hyphomicrobiales bacterium]|nr:hypothetical protein [Hyphomicrobiales bacterium]
MRRLVRAGAIWALAAAAAPAGPAMAQHPANAVFTAVELGACKVMKRHPDGNAWECRGLRNHPIYLAEGDLRTFISMGPSASKRRAASLTLRPFNTPFATRVRRFTVEWRVVPRSNPPIPYAAIVRLHTSNDAQRGQVLVVLKIGAQQTCHLAYVDALANEKAIEVARGIADERAPTFDCKGDPIVEGKSGRSPL